MRAVGVLGGTFDPVHIGHILLARSILERLPLDEIVMIPAGDPPHKQRRPDMAPVEDRWTMVCQAARCITGFSVSRVEMDRKGKSFTVETLARLQREHPDWELHLLIGEDNIGQIDSWQDPAGILSMCTVVAGSRTEGGGAPASRSRFEDQIVRISTPVFEVSSTEIRQRIKAGLSIRYLVPEAVESHIRRRGLYTGSAKMLT